MTTTAQFPSQLDSARLDDLIAKLKADPGDDARLLLIEHLQTAHVYLRGAMPAECAANLAMALRAARGLSDPALRLEAKQEIASLLERLCQSRYDAGHHLPR
jgi:hypothetical protein